MTSGGACQVIGVLTVIGLIAAALALPLLPRILQVEDTLQKADFILPLAGDWHRLIKTAELYKAGYAPKVVLSNARVRPPSRYDEIRRDMGFDMPAQREMRRRLMLHLGVRRLRRDLERRARCGRSRLEAAANLFSHLV